MCDQTRGKSWIAALALALLAAAIFAPAQARSDNSIPRADYRQANHAHEVDSLEFYVLANTQFTLFHELGHALINILQLPVLGREEDAADTLAIAGLLLGESEHLQQHLLERLIVVSDEWLLEWNESENQSAYWDSHGLEVQRFYNVVCLIYGSDTRRFEDIAFGSALPAERSFGCQAEFNAARHGVEWVLAEHGALEHLHGARERRANEKVSVSYETPTTPNGKWLAEVLAKDGLIERTAGDVGAAFNLPEKIEIQVVNCTDPDAYFNTESKIVFLCWPLLEKFLERGKRRVAAGPQSLCAAPVAARLRPSRLGCPTVADEKLSQLLPAVRL